jgi:hypothetical protein
MKKAGATGTVGNASLGLDDSDDDDDDSEWCYQNITWG